MEKPNTHHGNLARLPMALQPLTEEKHWVNWSWEKRTDANGKVKWTKPPLRSSDLKHASSTDPQTWSTYRRAVQRWQDGDADGIGYTLLGANYGAIDLDDCCRRDAERRKTTIDDWAKALRSEANGAYCEVTVSGGGLRLIGTATGDKVHRRFAIKDARPDAHVELFRKAERFITVSGLKLGQCDGLAPIDNVIDALLARHTNEQSSLLSLAGGEHTSSPRRDFDDLIRNGAPVGTRNENFHAVVWHLANQGRSIDDIVRELACHPDGIGQKYADRLLQEVTRSYEKWQRQNPARDHNLPVIKVIDGQIARIVDEAQSALLKAAIPIFVRAGQLVEPITVERETANSSSITTTTVFAQIREEKLAYLLNRQAARFEKFGRDGWVVTNPPAKVSGTLLALKGWKFPEVIGVVGAPTIRPDGSILSKQGYDPPTRLWLAAEFELPPIPEQPTREQAATALRLYKDLLSGFPFVNATDKAVAFAAILTAVLRGGFDLAPMFLITAHEAGTGKSYLADLIAMIVNGRPCPVMSPGKSAEEMEKRLGAILLEGGSMLSLDNLTFNLDSTECNTLCQMLTQLLVKIRILGQSAVPECEWRGTLFATGNNVQVLGELVRRTLTCYLDAKVERPEQREFQFDPIARVHSDRGAYIAAAIIIARAYRAYRAATNAKPLGGYPAWSALVREPLMWLGEHDPVASMDRAREADPARAAAYELLQRWQTRIGLDRAVTVRNIIAVANEMKPDRWEVHRFPKFRALLIEHAGTAKGDGIDPVKLGRWLQIQHGRVYGALRIDLVPHKGRSNEYVLRQIEGQD